MSTLAEYIAAVGGRLRLIADHQGRSTELRLPALHQDQVAVPQQREYRVIWQDQASRALVHVGWLEFTGGEFVFSYTSGAKTNAAFKPFPPFPRFDETYRSTELFPFFAMRLTSTVDPEFDAVLDALGLTRAEATPAELLAGSPGDSPHDTIQVVPEPIEMSDGTLVRTFLVSGIRHIAEQGADSVSKIIERLAEGDSLDLFPEPRNPSNPKALQLAIGGKPIGWVPNHLVDEVHSLQASGRTIAFEVARANGPSAPWHLRLLCRMSVSP